MPSSADEQQVLRIAEGKPVFRAVNIDAVHICRMFQRNHIGSLLVQLQKIAAVFVEKRKMRGDDDLVGVDSAVVRHSRHPNEFPHGRVLIDVQPF